MRFPAVVVVVIAISLFLLLKPTYSFPEETAPGKNGWTTHTQAAHAVEITYPKKWFKKEHFPQGLYQLFLSREKVEKPGDVFLVGISLVKIYRGSEVVGLRSNHPFPMAVAYMQAYMKEVESPVTKHAETIPVRTGDGIAYLSDLAFRDVYGKDIRGWIVVGYDPKEDTVVTMNLEAPVGEFEEQRPTFDRILKSVKMFRKEESLGGPGLPDLRFSQIMLSGFSDYDEVEAMSSSQRARYFQVWPEAKAAYEKSYALE